MASAATTETTLVGPVHPLHAFLLAATVPLFLGALLSDLSYDSNFEIQWNNFAAWLLAGAMVFAGFALLWSLIALFGARLRKGWPLITFLLLLAIFVLGLVDCFVHARDAFGTMPDGLILSAVVTVLAIVAAWVAFANLRTGAAR